MNTDYRVITVSCIMLAGALQGCAGSFETARSARSPAIAAAPRDDARCRSLDDQHRNWGAAAKAAAVVSGASGLATIPADSRGLEVGLAAGAVAVAAVAAGSVWLSESAAESWARECSE